MGEDIVSILTFLVFLSCDQLVIDPVGMNTILKVMVQV